MMVRNCRKIYRKQFVYKEMLKQILYKVNAELVIYEKIILSKTRLGNIQKNLMINER